MNKLCLFIWACSHTDTAPAEVGASGGPTFYSCNGQCGDPICEALFKTEGDLRQHISQRRGPQVWCPFCVCVCVCVCVCLCECICLYVSLCGCL